MRHYKQFNKKAKQANHKNICTNCDTKIRPNVDKCTVCILKFKAKKYLGSEDNWTILEDIFKKQKGRCPYTNIKLVLGVNCNIDHIQSKHKGGKNHANNLQWVFTPVNAMKGSMDEKEFLNLIKLIYHTTHKR